MLNRINCISQIQPKINKIHFIFQGPVLPQPLSNPEDLSRLQSPVDVSTKLGYVGEAITLTRTKLNGKVPLIGFSGAPVRFLYFLLYFII